MNARLLSARELPSRHLGVAERQAHPEAIELGPVGRCPHTPHHYIFLFDDSGSVVGGNDPVGRRYEEARLAIEHVARSCRCHRELISIRHFDCPTSGDVSSVPLRRFGGPLASLALQPPREVDLPCSNLGPAIATAVEEAARNPTHQLVLVIASDFELFDPDLPEVTDRLVTFGGTVHAIVLTGEVPDYLHTSPRATVTRIDWQSPRGAVASAVCDSLTTSRTLRPRDAA